MGEKQRGWRGRFEAVFSSFDERAGDAAPPPAASEGGVYAIVYLALAGVAGVAIAGPGAAAPF